MNSSIVKRQLFRHIAWIGLVGLLVVLMKVPVLLTAPPEEVNFLSGKLMLHGFLYRPEGNGPFPAVLYNHGSEQNPRRKPALGEFFSSRGYVFFLPHRRGHGRSPNDSTVESLYAQGAAGRIALHEIHLEDQLSALAYVKQLSYVDPQRIAVAGCSYGGFKQYLRLKPMQNTSWGCAPLSTSRVVL